MNIEPPVVLAQLPRPLGLGSKTRLNCVYGVSAGRKAKRYEVLAAADGEAVNLYDVSIPQLRSLPFLNLL